MERRMTATAAAYLIVGHRVRYLLLKVGIHTGSELWRKR